MGASADQGGTRPLDLASAHRRLLADPSLQFRFEPVPEPKPPAWMKPFAEFLKAVAPALQWVFWIGVALGVGLILFFIGRELLRVRWPERFGRRRPVVLGAETWRPTEAQARALLEDVDRLAAQGRFADAVHLLLHRSIQDIQSHRPRLVRPALTSRDISALPALPEAARGAFAGIARVVEHSRFGGAAVDADAFAACRRAYEAFAFPEVWA